MNSIKTRITRLNIHSITSILPAIFSMLLWMAFMLCPFEALSQITYADTLDCQGGTPTFIVDLSNSADSIWVSPPTARGGQCCSPPDVVCAQFTVTLSPDAAGLNFTVPNGCGAKPSGSLFYHVNCGPPVPVGTPICLGGTGPFNITFCKPGNNLNCYSIQSIPGPQTTPDQVTSVSCFETMSVTNMIVPTITWTSIAPGAPGTYNANLNCTSACTTVNFTPTPLSPPSITYVVCGNVVGACPGISDCDTTTIFIVPNVGVDILPANPAICFGSPGTVLTATPSGGAAPFTYQWNTGATTQSILATTPGTYWVEIEDSTHCTSAADTIVVTQFSNTITANAGPDISICKTPVPTVTINGAVTGTTTGIWSHGAGTYTPGTTSMSIQYTPTAAEIAAGFAELFLTTTNNKTCPGDVDTMKINLTNFSSILDTTITNVSCFGLADGSIDVIAPGITTPATYVWNTGQVTQDISGLVAGTYKVVITDAPGCKDSLNIAITQPSPLTIISTIYSMYPSGSNISCFGATDGAINITPAGGTPPYSFLWINGATTEDLTNVPAGNYSVTITDAHGCQLTQNYTLVQPTVLTQSTTAFAYPSGDHISCFGLSDGFVDLTISGGSPGYNYLWSSGATAQDLSGVAAGTYTVTVTDFNGCLITSTITLSEPTMLTENASAFVYPSGDHISCFGLSDGSVDLTIGGGSPGYTYVWNTGATTQDLSNIPAGSYDVTVTDINGCIITSLINLTEPVALTQNVTAFIYPSGDNISCFGLSDGAVDLTIGGGSPGYTYVWNNAATTQDLTNIPAGAYNVTATDLNGCTIASSITITEPAAVTENVTAFVYPSGENISCFGLSDGSVDLTIGGGSPGYTYVWNNGATTQDLVNIPAGSYNVTATDLNGCTITSFITLTEPATLTQNVTAFVYPSGDNISCFGLSDGSVDLTIGGGSPGYTYLWSNGAVTEDLSGVIAGTYNVTVTDLNGCTITSSITLIEPAALTENVTAVVYPSGDNISCFGLSDGSVDLTIGGGSPGYTYLWSNGAVTEDLVNIPVGSYNVTATDLNGCTIASSITLTEPAALTQNVTSFVYPSGDNISCFGLSDGAVDLTIGGGSPGYAYVWNNGATTQDLSGVIAGTYNVTVTDLNGCTIASTITLTEPAVLTQNVTTFVYPSGDNISCFGLSDGSVDLTIGGGSPGYTYVWNNGATTQDLSGVIAGTYNVTVTDLNGCTITSSITLIEPAALTENVTAVVYPSGDNISCFGLSDGSVDLTIGGGSPGYTYVWNNGATTQDLNGIPVGNYSVTATDVNGCAITSSITLTEPAALTQNVTSIVYPSGDNISCFGLSDGSVDLTIGGGSPSYTYVWNNGATTQDLNGIPVGNYSVTATDVNGCAITSSIILTEPAALTENVTSFVYPSGDNISCFGLSDGLIDLTIGGGSPGYTYVWSNGTTTQDLSGVIAGTYNVTVTDLNGCTITSSIALIEPAALTQNVTAFVYPSGDNISCFGLSDGSVDLTIGGGSPGYTYVWNNGATTQDLNGIPVGNYSVTATDVNGCAITSSITLTEPAALTENVTSFLYPSGDNISCFGLSDGSVDLTIGGGSPGYTYLWNNGGITEDLSGVIAGTYNVIVTDLNGCTIASSITLTEPVVLTQNVTAFVYPSGDNISCFGLSDGSVDLTIGGGSPGYTYVWSNGATTQDLSGVIAGTYNVTATDLNGCTIASSITLTEPAALTENVIAFVYPSGDNISCFALSDGSVDLTIGGGSPSYTYVWNNGATTQDLNGIPVGNYSVTATDVNGCAITSSITLTEPAALTQNVTAFVYPSGDNISCFGLSDGSVDLTIGGGSPGYTYLWNNGAITEDLVNVSAGTYDVTATDLNGCTITSSIALTEPAALTQNVTSFVYPSGDNISCFGLSDGSVDLTIGGGSPGYTYVWNNGAVTEDLSGVSAGTYNVTATDLNGCTITSFITLTEPAALTENVTSFVYPSGDNISCFGLSDGSVDLTIGGGSPGYTYVWSNGATTQDLSGVIAGTYNVTATDLNGCTIASSITLTEPAALTENVIAFVYPSGDNISCFALSDGSVDLTIGGGSPSYTYVWNNGATTQDLVNIPVGSYNVTATDLNGCTIASSITLTEPAALTQNVTASVYPSGDNISCFGLSDGSVDLTIGGGSPGYTYVWNNGSTTQDLSGVSAGTYDVTVTDLNGCTIASTITLIEPAALTENVTAVVYPSGDNISCFGFPDGAVDLTIGGGSTGYTYVWNNGSTTQDLSGVIAGTYNVTVTDLNGCTIASTITLTEPAALTENVTAFVYPSGDNISCFGLSDGSVDLTIGGGSPSYTYVWNNGATTQDLNGIPVGNYSVTATDVNGCAITSSITLTEPAALTENVTSFLYPSGDNISCFGLSDGSVDLTIGGGSPGHTYVWNNGAVTEDLVNIPVGSYNVTATDLNGCTIASSITLTEPAALTQNVTSFVYPSGDNISCFGLSDGSVDLTIGGGSPGYTYVWNNGATTQDLSGVIAGTYNVTATDLNGCTITSSIILTEPAALNKNIIAFVYPSGDNISCFGLSDGSIDLTIGGGSPGYTYVWNNGATTEDLASVPPGVYTVNVTDLNGCSINAAIILTQPTALTQNVIASVYPSGDNISCFGLSDGSTDLTIGGGSPGYTYLWNNGAITEDLVNVPAGTYDVTVTDINGCTITSSITLTEPAALIQNVITSVYPSGDNISCFGLSDGSIDLTIGGGSPGYTFAWSNGAITEDQAVIPAASYDVTVTDLNGCTITSTIVLTEPAALTENVTAFVYPSGDNISCFGLSDGSVDLTIGGGSPAFSYLWNTGAVTEDLANIPVGLYDVTVTDVNGCTITSSITLTEPAILTQNVTAFVYPSGDNISCFGLSDGSTDLTIGGGSPGYSYLWNNAAITEDLVNVPAGVYDVTVTDINGCTITSSITLTEPTMLTQNIVTSAYPSGDNISCFGLSDGSIDLTIGGGSPGYTYVWNNGATSQDLTNIPAGSYDVTVTDMNGCTITSTIVLTEPAALTENVTAFIYPSGDNISCFGLSDGSVDLTIGGGSPAFSYLWNTGAVTEDLANIPVGLYDVTVTDVNGCTITSSITLTEPAILTQNVTAFVYTSGDNISCFGLSDGSTDLTIGGGSPGYTYLWNNGGITEDLVNVPAGTYDVTVTDINGCTITSSITLTEPTMLTQNIVTSAYPSGDNISCFGLSDGSIDLTIGGGSPGYTFAWSNGAITEDQAVIPAASYDVTVTDLNGCTITSTIVLTEPAALTENVTAFVYPSGDNISCFGLSDGSVNLTIGGGSPAFSYLWNTGAVTEDLANIPAGSYDVTVTDVNGCTITSTITLTEPAALSIALAPSIFAGGYNVSGCADDGSIDLTVTGGSPGFTYDWSNSDTNEDPAALGEGTYTVLVTDVNGCTITDSVFLDAADPLDTSAVISVYTGGWNVSCYGASDGFIDLTVTGGYGPYNFIWSNGALTEDLNGIPAGAYTVIITDSHNCEDSLTFNLTEPGDIFGDLSSPQFQGGYNISCFSLSDGIIDMGVTGGTAPYTYLWNTSDTIEDLAGLPAGTYDVTITDVNGCSNNFFINLTEPLELVATIDVLTDYYGQGVSCTGAQDGEAEVSVAGGTPVYTCAWNTAPVQTTAIASDLAEGTHVVSITDANGCVTTDTVTLTANPLPAVIAPASQVICYGQEAIIISETDNGNTCQWSFSNGAVLNDCGPSPMVFNYVGCLDAELTVTNAQQCQSTLLIDDYICVNPAPEAGFSPQSLQITTIPSDVDFVNASDGAISYLWNFGDGHASTQTDVNHVFPDDVANEYDVTLVAYNEFGCTDTAYGLIRVVEEFIMYVPNAFTPDGDGDNNIFMPVISEGYLPKGYTLFIYNRWGEILFESHDVNVGWDGTYSDNGLVEDGVYIWTIEILDEEQQLPKLYRGHVTLLK